MFITFRFSLNMRASFFICSFQNRNLSHQLAWRVKNPCELMAKRSRMRSLMVSVLREKYLPLQSQEESGN